MNEQQKTMSEASKNNQLTYYTAQIVSAHVSHNRVEAGELPELIKQIYSCLNKLEEGTLGEEAQKTLEPAVPINRSVKPDYIVCLEDGKKLKILKRYLKTTYNMTPEEYKERWGLRSDYPMVAPNYAQKRSNLAKTIGLGRVFRKQKSKSTKKAASR